MVWTDLFREKRRRACRVLDSLDLSRRTDIVKPEIPIRVDFKIAVLVFQCLTGQAPGYLAEDCQLVADVSVRRLRSAATATCVTRRTSNIFGDRCFAAAGPRLWNSLPINLRQCRSLEQFKRLLKTFLFSA